MIIMIITLLSNQRKEFLNIYFVESVIVICKLNRNETL